MKTHLPELAVPPHQSTGPPSRLPTARSPNTSLVGNAPQYVGTIPTVRSTKGKKTMINERMFMKLKAK